MVYVTHYKSPIGKLLLASDGINLTGVWIENQKFYGNTLSFSSIKKENLPIFKQTKIWLDNYFEGKQPEFNNLSLAPCGTNFRIKVWQVLCKIPYGRVITYGDIAKEIGCNGNCISAQAVGGAVGHNPISIIIPCHRVIGSTGKLVGYAGGLDIKIKLLKLEGIDITNLLSYHVEMPR